MNLEAWPLAFSGEIKGLTPRGVVWRIAALEPCQGQTASAMGILARGVRAGVAVRRQFVCHPERSRAIRIGESLCAVEGPLSRWYCRRLCEEFSLRTQGRRLIAQKVAIGTPGGTGGTVRKKGVLRLRFPAHSRRNTLLRMTGLRHPVRHQIELLPETMLDFSIWQGGYVP